MNPKEIFKDNIKLAYKIYSKYLKSVPSSHLEDLKQESLIGLWKAAKTFKKENKIAFSTYAYIVINNEMLKYLRTLKKHKSGISLYEEIGENICVLDTIADDEDYFEKIEDKEAIKEILSIMQKCDDRSMRILRLRLQGKTQKEIANEFRISQTYVSRLLRKAIKNIQEMTKEEEKCN